MSAFRRFRGGRGRRFWLVGATVVAAAAFGIVFVAASGAVLPGSPSGFESSDGNMTLDATAGNNTDWNCFVNSDNFAHNGSTPSGCKVTSGAKQLTADANGEITWVNGQKFDTQCPALETGNVPNKDDFTNVASFTDQAANNDVFFYGATIRAVANGDASGDVEFNQNSGDGTTTAGCRTAGDLLLAYDFSVGGTVLDFHVLTWIDSTNPTAGGNNGTCFVKTDSMPCWGAVELTPVTTEGLTNQAAILAADNGISGTDLAAQQFAEFGVNLTQALGLNASCLAFPQLVWESRSSGSSFTSNPEDIEIEHATIDTCAQPSLTTKLSADSILNTDSVTDTATLSGATSDASGAITISAYSGNDANACVAGNLVTSETATPATNGNGDYSATFSGLAAGSYEFQASIPSDSKNLGAVSPCGSEPLTVQNQPSLSTKLSADNILNTDSVTDTATLSGATSDASGAITISVYSGSDSNACVAGNFVTSQTATPATNGNGDYSATFSGLAAGSYEFQASIAADSKNLSAVSPCGSEPLTVMNQPSLSTKLSADSILNTDSVTDTATLSGATSDASGAITISVYSGSGSEACTGDAVTSKTASPATNGNGDYSATFSGLAAGSYEFQASIAADSKNLSAVSPCGSEPLTVQNQPTVTTTQDPASGSVGDTYNDSAVLSGGAAPTGTITFDLYDNATCSGTAVDEESVPVDGNGTYATPTGTTVTSAGTYYWVASYSGDGNNKPAASGCADEPVVVNGAAIQIVKTPDNAQVNAGEPIGFTLTVYNTGNGDAHGVVLTDTLPVKPGLSWSIDSTGLGWASSCGIVAGTLTCGPVTVPGNTTQAASTFTVHITSPTTGATGGDCPGGSGVVTNTGDVSTVNDGSGESTASTCVQAVVDLSITKSGSPAVQDLGQGNITWTMVVTNNGPSADTGVTISDPMPAGNTFVSASSTQGTCTGGAILTCDIGDMAAGASVTITLVTTPSQAGTQTNTVVVSGDKPETNVANNTATASVEVTAPLVLPCVKVSKIRPHQLFVGRKTTLTIHLTQAGKAKAGIRVRITGKKFAVVTKRSNAKGIIKKTVKLKRSGVLVFTPLTTGKRCVGRIGVTGVFTPPVTG